MGPSSQGLVSRLSEQRRRAQAQWPPNRSDITATFGSQAWFRQGSPNAASMDFSKEKLV